MRDVAAKQATASDSPPFLWRHLSVGKIATGKASYQERAGADTPRRLRLEGRRASRYGGLSLTVKEIKGASQRVDLCVIGVRMFYSPWGKGRASPEELNP